MNTTHEASASLTAKSTFSTPRSVIVLSIAASIVTMLLKFGAYFLTGSVSLLSDAAESSVNLIAALVAFGALTVVARPADRAHNYGHDKAEYFSSGVEGALILVAATTIIYTAVKRFLNPVPLTDLGLGLAISLVASGINFGVSRFMLRSAKRFDSITLEADAHHLMTDVWTSVGVVAALAVVMFAPPKLGHPRPHHRRDRGVEHHPHRREPDPQVDGRDDGLQPAGRRGRANRGSDPGQRRPRRDLPRLADAEVRVVALHRISSAGARRHHGSNRP